MNTDTQRHTQKEIENRQTGRGRDGRGGGGGRRGGAGGGGRVVGRKGGRNVRMKQLHAANYEHRYKFCPDILVSYCTKVSKDLLQLKCHSGCLVEQTVD